MYVTFFFYLCFKSKPFVFMNKTLHFQILKTVFLAFFLLCCCSKASTEPGEVPGPDSGSVSGETSLTADEFKTFLADRIAACEYCRSLTVKAGYFEISCLRGNSCRLSKENTPLLSVGNNGNWLVDLEQTDIPTGEAIAAGTTPTVSVNASGRLVVDGTELGTVAGDPLRCIIDTRKHVYACFRDGTVALGSEIHGTYNPELPANKSRLRILFIGNSFTQDATEHLPGILAAAGVKNVEMTRAYHGGYTLPEYNDHYSETNICARRDCPAGGAKWEGDNTLDSSLEEILESGTWDIVTLQEHTGKEVAWSWPGSLQEALGGLVEKIHAAQPEHRPTICYLMAQTYGRGSSILTTYYDNDRSKMFGLITDIVRKIQTQTCIDRVIPSGTMLENLRTTSINIDNGMDLTRDSYHMDFGISRYAAACTVFESIIAPSTGKTLDGNSYRFDESSTEDKKYTTPVTDANAPVAIRAAREACRNPFEVTNLSEL